MAVETANDLGDEKIGRRQFFRLTGALFLGGAGAVISNKLRKLLPKSPGKTHETLSSPKDSEAIEMKRLPDVPQENQTWLIMVDGERQQAKIVRVKEAQHADFYVPYIIRYQITEGSDGSLTHSEAVGMSGNWRLDEKVLDSTQPQGDVLGAVRTAINNFFIEKISD
ncbi:MAG: hypothetical protein WDZ94_04040 [Patescibacteria group bacterium]